MSIIILLHGLAKRIPMQAQEPGLAQTLQQMLAAGPDIGTILFAFTLAIFVVLVFGVRLLLIVRKRPVPVDPLDMAKPADFRTLMVAGAAFLAPLAAIDFLPVEGLPLQWVLAVAYAFQMLLAVVLWLALEGFYRIRASRRAKRP
jgi:hypothetical protein